MPRNFLWKGMYSGMECELNPGWKIIVKYGKILKEKNCFFASLETSLLLKLFHNYSNSNFNLKNPFLMDTAYSPQNHYTRYSLL